MPADFDPYRKWLGIPVKEQPPNHYRLLGLELFEVDPDVIDAGAEQRMTFLQTCATGPHAALSQKLMNEVSRARLCLLDPKRRASYDVSLQAKVGLSSSEQKPEAASRYPQPIPDPRQIPPESHYPVTPVITSPDALQLQPTAPWLGGTPRGRPKRSRRLILAAAVCVGIVVLLMVGTWTFSQILGKIRTVATTEPPASGLTSAPVSESGGQQPIATSPTVPPSKLPETTAEPGGRSSLTLPSNDATLKVQRQQLDCAAALNVPVEYENSIGMKFRLIPAGEFLMGSTEAEIAAAILVSADWEKEFILSEAPQHRVMLTQPFYLGVHEVTQAHYEQVMGTNPSAFAPMGANKDFVAGLDTANFPVDMATWNGAAEFCAKLSQQEQLKPSIPTNDATKILRESTGYRLPTEAEWEFACKAGTTTKHWNGDKEEQLVMVGWCNVNCGGRPHDVGGFKANPFGLFDIHGNVWEWVKDWWSPTYYGEFTGSPAVDPTGPADDGSLKVLRGGRWQDSPSGCRSADRRAFGTGFQNGDTGFRVAISVEAVKALRDGGEANEIVENPEPDSMLEEVDQEQAPKTPPPAISPFDAETAADLQTAWAEYLKVDVEITNSIGMKLRLVPPGSFKMGTPGATKRDAS